METTVRKSLHRGWIAAALVLSALASAPVFALDSNTGETTEIQFSVANAPDLNAQAAALASPVSIFEYVSNNYEYALYHGARGGSVNTFLGGRGNDVDLAATLIAMLRSRGIPSRYVVGTVRAPSGVIANWLGVKNVDLAYHILRDQGIQGVVLSADKTTIDLEHVWVEALLPYAHYRGAGNSTVNCVSAPLECNWAPLDPSAKQHVIRTSGLDPANSVSFDYPSYYNAIKNNDATRRDKNPLTIYEEQLLAWLQINAPGKTLDDIPDVADRITHVSGLLPASLPFTVISAVRRYNSVADHDAAVPATEQKKWGKTLSMTIKLVVTTSGGGTVTLQVGAGSILLTQLATQRLTLTTEISGGIPNMVVRLDGTEIARPISGSGQISGYTPAVGNPFTLTVSMDGTPAPDSSSTDRAISATYNAIIGGYYLLATGGETSNWSQVHRAAQQLLDANTQYKIVFNPGEAACQPGGINCTPYVDLSGNGWDASDPRLLDDKPALDSLTGGLLYVAATQYFAKVREQFERADELNKIKTPLAGFLGVVSTTYGVEYVDGTAFSVLPDGLLIDMKGITISGSWKIDQPATSSNAQFEFLGHIVSSLEHETWQELTGYDAISTVRGIQMALASGASLLDLTKNTTTDTVQSMYPAMGFGSAVPAGFTLDHRSIYSTLMDSWSYSTTDGTQQFTLLEKHPTGSTDPRLLRLTYANDFLDGNLGCFYSTQNTLQSLLNTYGPSQTLSAGSLCISSFPAGTTIASAIALNQSDYATYRTSYVGATAFDYLDENKGFNTANFVFRGVNGLANNAQPASSVQIWRSTLYLQDLTQAWNEIVVPSTLATGSYFRFSVDILKTYNTSNNLQSATFEIQNMQGVSAGGGYVPPGGIELKQSTSISVSGSTNVLPTFNNATLTDQNTIAEVNNNVIKTPSTSDPVSTVTGNNYHDETDFTIKGRGLNYAFTRTYNSAPSSTKSDGPLGFGWTHSYDMKLKSNDYGSCPNCAPGGGAGQRPENGNNLTSSITYTDERGGDHSYLVNESTFAITTPQGEFDSLAFDTPIAGQHTLTFRNGVKYIFEGASNIKSVPNVTARLKQIADPWGNQLNFTYESSGRLSTVTDNLAIGGRSGLVFNYDTAGHLVRIADWTGRQWQYFVDSSSNLLAFINPLAQQTRYTYAAGSHSLFEVIKPLKRGSYDVKTAFKYYENGRAFNYANALGHTETLDYDLYRKSTRVTDPRGGTREYFYDDSGRMTKLVEPDGAILLFNNTASDGLRYLKTNGLGYPTQYSYRTDKAFSGASDTAGNVTREQDALSNTVDSTYGPFDQVATLKDKRGTIRTTSFHATTDGTCKAAGKPDSLSLSTLSGVPNVRLQSLCWFADGALKTTTDFIAPGNLSRYRQRVLNYDAAHLNVLSVTEVGTDGTTVTRSFSYDPLGRKISETLQRRTSPTDATLLNLTTNYTYDALDRVTLVQDPLGNQLVTVYDANGQVSQLVGRYKQPDNSYVTRILSTRVYDAADRMVQSIDVYNVVTQFQYDADSNLIAVIDPYQHTTKYEYDAMNRRTAVIDANGNRTTTTYDFTGQVKSITNANGETVTNSYDALGRLTQVQDALGFSTQFSYDPNGNMACRIDANAQAGLQPKNSDNCTESRVYDELNRVTQVKDALNGLTITTYDLLSNVTSIKDASNRTTSFVYDDLGRRIQSNDPLNKTTILARDQAGNVFQVTNRLGQITRITFDALNRPTRYDYLTDGTNETIAYDPFGNKQSASNGVVSYTFGYDAKNRLISKLDSRSGRTLTFGYDGVDNMISKQDYQNQSTDFQYDSANRLVSMSNKAYLKAMYQYDPAGRLLSRVLSDGARSLYGWDAGGRLTSLSMSTANNTLLNTSNYTRDRVGNVTVATETAGTTNYAYDALYRLTSADYPGAANDEAFTYDNVGNRLTHTLNGQLRTYQYFANGNRLSTVRLGGASGTIEKSFTYDDEGRMVTQSGGSASGYPSGISWDQKNRAKTMTSSLGSTTTFNYDPMDYRIGRTGGSLGARDYYLEGEHLEAEYSSGVLKSKFFRGITTDELVAGFNYATGQGVPSIYHQDQLTSVTGTSAHDGTTQQTFTYSAFGNTQSSTGTTTSRLRYTGRELDSDTQCYYYRARYYCPDTGRFITEDPLGFGAGINFYTYVNNNPINGNDPSGQDPLHVGAAIVGGMGGLLFQAGADVYHGKLSSFADYAGATAGGAVGGAAGVTCGPMCGGAAAGAMSNLTTQGINALEGKASSWIDSVGSFFHDTVQGAIGGKIAGVAVPFISKTVLPAIVGSSVANSIKGSIGEGLSWLDAVGSGRGIPRGPVSNGFGKSTFDWQLPDGTFIESKFGTAGLNSGAQTAAANYWESQGLFELQSWTYPTVSGIVGSSFGGAAAGPDIGGAAGGFLLYPNKPNTNQIQAVYSK